MDTDALPIIEKTLAHVWYPTAQMQDYRVFSPVPVQRAAGVYLYLEDGRRLMDVTSSWWCKVLGHAHPRVMAAMHAQLNRFDHIMMPHTTHTVLATLSQQLCTLMPPLDRIFYAGDGACAVEIAIKMALFAQQLSGRPERGQFMGLENGYHGETALTMALSDIPGFTRPYQALLPPTAPCLRHLPYVQSEADPLWEDSAAFWPAIERQLMAHKEKLAGIIVEPLAQGAGGMRFYSRDFLRRLRHWCDQHAVYLIADEIMTGFGRTGTLFACQKAGIVPDWLCLAKGLTGGALPMSAVLTRSSHYQLFYGSHESGKAFLHSHTHSGNALACAAALATLSVLNEMDINAHVAQLSGWLYDAMQGIAQRTGALHSVRSMGAIVAADIAISGLKLDPKKRWGFEFYRRAIEQGLLMRPIGNTLYWSPPLITTQQDMHVLAEATEKTLKKTLKSL